MARLIRAVLKHERILIAVAVGIVIIAVCVVFSLPLKTVEYESVETYYETEITREPETVSEPYTVEQQVERSEVVLDGYHIMVPHGISAEFEVDKDDVELYVSFDSASPGICNIFDVSSSILYEMIGSKGSFSYPLEKGAYKVRFREDLMWGEEIYMRVELRWTETVEVTQYREVTVYHEVPVQVEKKRTVWDTEEISLWQWFFR
jgi:hypothetical protein